MPHIVIFIHKFISALQHLKHYCHTYYWNAAERSILSVHPIIATRNDKRKENSCFTKNNSYACVDMFVKLLYMCRLHSRKNNSYVIIKGCL